MFFHCKVAVLMLALSLDGLVHTGRIIGGHEVKPHSRPYMVLLVRHTQNGTKYCGGFLLNEDYVMTAAHCHGKTFKVFLGLHDYYNLTGVQSLEVEESLPHKGYDNNDLSNDIMLLKLKGKAKITNNVKPIALAGQDDLSLPDSCSVSGWGETKKGGYMSIKLREINVTMIDSKQCLEQRLYCTVGVTGPGEGDSGGPLVCDGVAYGVVSGQHETISKYTKIPDYRDWTDCVMKHKGKY